MVNNKILINFNNNSKFPNSSLSSRGFAPRGVVLPPNEIAQTITGPVGIFYEDSNPIGLAVTEILSFQRR